MKRLLILVAIFFAGIILNSCAGSQKHCAAYAKHDTNEQPTYKDVQ